jgi:hypothetical protein
MILLRRATLIRNSISRATIHHTSARRQDKVMASVLFMGIGGDDPSLQLTPNVSSQELNAAIDKGSQSLTDAGYKVTLFLPPMMDGIAALEKELQLNKHDLVLVGVSDRYPMSTAKDYC